MQNASAEKYLNSVSSPNLSLENERELFSIIKSEESSDYEKDLAKEKICRSHIRFVSQIASYYYDRCNADMEDLIGAGVLGMMTAIEKFDLSKNNKFTTYCGWWIKLEVIRCIQKDFSVKIPQNIHDGLIKIQTAIKESGEISREDLKEKLGFSEEKMQKLDKAKVNVVSLQKKKGGEEESFLLEDIISDDSLNPYEVHEKDDLLKILKGILDDLDEKTREIVMSKYMEEKVSLKKLSEKYGLSQERIRQIRVKATEDLESKLLNKRKK